MTYMAYLKHISTMAGKEQTEHVLALGRNDIQYYLNTFDPEGSTSSLEENKDPPGAQEQVRNPESIPSSSRTSELNIQENSTFERPAILELTSENSSKLLENSPSLERQINNAKIKSKKRIKRQRNEVNWSGHELPLEYQAPRFHDFHETTSKKAKKLDQYFSEFDPYISETIIDYNNNNLVSNSTHSSEKHLPNYDKPRRNIDNFIRYEWKTQIQKQNEQYNRYITKLNQLDEKKNKHFEFSASKLEIIYKQTFKNQKLLETLREEQVHNRQIISELRSTISNFQSYIKQQWRQ